MQIWVLNEFTFTEVMTMDIFPWENERMFTAFSEVELRLAG